MNPCSVCLIRVEVERPGSPLLTVLTTHDLSGRVVDEWRLSDPEAVVPLVQAFLDRAVPNR